MIIKFFFWVKKKIYISMLTTCYGLCKKKNLKFTWNPFYKKKIKCFRCFKYFIVSKGKQILMQVFDNFKINFV